MAIIRYLGRKFGLAATSDPAIAKEDMFLFQINEMIERMIISNYYKQPYASEEDFQKEMNQLRTELNEKLELLEKFLEPGKWFTGEKMSYVDFLAYETLDWYRELVQPDCLKKHEKLSAFMKQFEALDKLRDYLASDSYRKD